MSKDAMTLWTGGGLVAAGAVVGAVAGALLTNWLGARRDRRTHEHEQVMAREARRQERLEQAYLELLRYLSHYLDWARSVRPIVGPVPVPDPLPREERWRIEALVTAYGSPEVLRLLREWGERAAKIEDVDATLRLLEQSRNPSPESDREAMQENRALPGYKQAMFDADKAIRDRVQRELAGET
jgi:hypothetical protein